MLIFKFLSTALVAISNYVVPLGVGVVGRQAPINLISGGRVPHTGATTLLLNKYLTFGVSVH